jgi:membrane fusion protein (multidrug efflux system)
MRMILTLCVSAAMLAACGGGDAAQKKGRDAPLVTLAAVQSTRFVERIDAVGTARANEQVTLTAPVTQRIVRLNFDDGAYVTRGQVIAVLEAATQNAQLAQAQARSREAQQQLRRLEELRARGFATRSAVDAQVALAGAASGEAAEARAGIADRVVRAPFGGWVSLRNISAGAVVTAGTEIVTVSDVSRIKLDFPVPETLLAQLRPGQSIVAVAAAYPDQPFRGTIDTIDPVLSPQTRAATVRAVLANGDRRLKPGMLLTVAIEAQSRNSPAVPELAVVGEGEQSFVFTVENGKAKRLPVRTGLRQNGMVEIVQGLRPGQRVVTEGVVKIADGQTVRSGAAGNAQPKAEAAREPTPQAARTGKAS